MEADSFVKFIAAIRAGDNAGAERLFDRYHGPLVRQASERLSQRVQVRVAPEDLVQSCFKTFVRRAADGQFDMEHWGDVWAILVGIIVRKSRNAARYHHRHRRSVAAEHDDGGDGWELPDRDPTPDEHAELNETIERLLEQFDADDRRVIELSLLNYTPTEISDQLQRAIRGVHRVRAAVRAYLERDCSPTSA